MQEKRVVKNSPKQREGRDWPIGWQNRRGREKERDTQEEEGGIDVDVEPPKPRQRYSNIVRKRAAESIGGERQRQ
jgi:hypothetical protein